MAAAGGPVAVAATKAALVWDFDLTLTKIHAYSKSRDYLEYCPPGEIQRCLAEYKASRPEGLVKDFADLKSWLNVLERAQRDGHYVFIATYGKYDVVSMYLDAVASESGMVGPGWRAMWTRENILTPGEFPAFTGTRDDEEGLRVMLKKGVGKNIMLHRVQEMTRLPRKNIVLFDDTPENTTKAQDEGYAAIPITRVDFYNESKAKETHAWITATVGRAPFNPIACLPDFTHLSKGSVRKAMDLGWAPVLPANTLVKVFSISHAGYYFNLNNHSFLRPPAREQGTFFRAAEAEHAWKDVTDHNPFAPFKDDANADRINATEDLASLLKDSYVVRWWCNSSGSWYTNIDPVTGAWLPKLTVWRCQGTYNVMDPDVYSQLVKMGYPTMKEADLSLDRIKQIVQENHEFQEKAAEARHRDAARRVGVGYGAMPVTKYVPKPPPIISPQEQQSLDRAMKAAKEQCVQERYRRKRQRDREGMAVEDARSRGLARRDPPQDGGGCTIM